MQLKYARQLTNNKRVHVIRAVQLAVDRYFNGEIYTSILFPPRYGKSSVIRLLALELYASTKLPTVMTAPWTDNVDQIKEKEKIQETFKHYGVPLSTQFETHRVTALPTHEWWRLSENKPTLLTCTLGLINNAANQQVFIDGLWDMKEQSGFRPIVDVDECHLIKDPQPWGIFIEKCIQETGAYIVLQTGTPVPNIPGFDCAFSDWQDVVRHIPRGRRFVNGELKKITEKYEGQSRSGDEIHADIEVTWEEAWNVGALAEVNAVWIDCDVVDEDKNESLGPLSKLNKVQLSGRIKQIMESTPLMQLQVNAALHRLFDKRHAKPQTQALVLTGADEWDARENKREINRHATQFKNLFAREAKQFGKHLRIEIVTGETVKAADRIKAFRRGEIDVLIVKMMGIVGLDVPPCKVLVWGSRMRKGPLAIQALSRPLTTWEGTFADLILPKDCLMIDLYNRVVKDQGGEYHESKLQLTDTIISDLDARPAWRFETPRIDSYSDRLARMLNGNYELILQTIKSKYDTHGLSDLQIIQNFERGGFPISDADKTAQKTATDHSGIKDLDEDLANWKGQFGPEADRITHKHIDYRSERDKWIAKNKELKAVAKERCNVAQYISVPDIDDAALLKRLFHALKEVENAVFSAI